MLKIFTFLFHTFPLILSWLYLLVAICAVVVHIKKVKSQQKRTIGQWVLAIINGAYVMLFWVTGIFFHTLWETVFSVLGLMAIFVSFIWSRYEDMRSGQRWWEW